MENKWQEEYSGLMEKVHFSKEEKEDMIQKLVEGVIYDKDATGRKYHPHGNTILKKTGIRGAIAACIAVCLLVTGAVGVSASGILKPVSTVFAQVFYLVNDNQELVEEMGSSLGKSAVSNGVRVTADAVIADKFAYVIIFSVEREDGQALDEGKNLATDAWEFDVNTVSVEAPEEDIGNWGTMYSYDEDPTDPSIQYVIRGAYDREIGEQISVHLSDLYNYDTSSGGHNLVTKGDWNLQIPVRISDASISLETGQTAIMDGYEVSIDEIVISPLSYHLSCSIDNESKDVSAAQFQALLDNGPAKLELKNGKRINMCDNVIAMHFKDDYIEGIYEDFFDTLIDLKDMKSIHIGDVEIPIQ